MKKFHTIAVAMAAMAFASVASATTAGIDKLSLYARAFGEIAYAHINNFMANKGLMLGVNNLTGLIPTMFEALDTVSREAVGFIPAVKRNSSAEKAALGQVITIPVTQQGTLIDITPGVTAAGTGGQTVAPNTMTISKSKAYEVLWGGEEQRGQLNAGTYNSTLLDQFMQGFRTLANAVEGDLASLAINASRAYGTAGTTPFGVSADLSDFAQSRKILIDNGAPQTDLQMVMNTAAAANMRGKQAGLFKVNEAGSEILLRTGSIALPVDGFYPHESGQIKSFTKGTGTNYTSNTAGYAAGATVVNIITGTGTVLAGDVVSWAGDPNKYVVAVGNTASGPITLAAPGLLQAIPAAATAMTIGGSYTANLAFNRSAIQLITRAPAMPVGPDGKPMDMADDVVEMVDPISGLVYQIAMYKMYRQIKYEIGLAWGVKAAKSEHIALLLG
ncbi:P22 phage major capsid protein family protein [Janthinobacterium sp. SUN137]|uniref:P22 phage major capsid protein family protein n=1 Tax=Janthinobacterium sp. SUN137 TaxID=3014789 RepID=UPI002712CEA9|nr:P22 phage major capsid protein family protein [Janthinobacterium sp. SUN137]MDO8039499.1 P22 coat - protein 5 family protein [Janthinobacterium sp. SUN137]